MAFGLSSVPCRGYELQPSREGTEAAFFREKGDGVALQIRATHRRTRETEPPDCGTFKGTEGAARAEPNLFGLCRVAFEEE